LKIANADSASKIRKPGTLEFIMPNSNKAFSSFSIEAATPQTKPRNRNPSFRQSQVKSPDMEGSRGTEENVLDPRVRRTRKMLQDALASLLKKRTLTRFRLARLQKNRR